jgi:hypothetical protein
LSIDLSDGLDVKERATDNRLLLRNNKKRCRGKGKGVKAAGFICDFDFGHLKNVIRFTRLKLELNLNDLISVESFLVH